MHTRRLAIAIITLALGISGCSSDNDNSSNVGGEMIPAPVFCAQAPNDQLCSFIPHDILETFENGYSQLSGPQQRAFDNFSWQTFVALNWPATADGTPALHERELSAEGVEAVLCDVGDFDRVQANVEEGEVDVAVEEWLFGGLQDRGGLRVELVALGDELQDRQIGSTESFARLGSLGEPSLRGDVEDAEGRLIRLPDACRVFGLGDGDVERAMEIKTAWRILDASTRATRQSASSFSTRSSSFPPTLIGSGRPSSTSTMRRWRRMPRIRRA